MKDFRRCTEKENYWGPFYIAQMHKYADSPLTVICRPDQPGNVIARLALDMKKELSGQFLRFVIQLNLVVLTWITEACLIQLQLECRAVERIPGCIDMFVRDVLNEISRFFLTSPRIPRILWVMHITQAPILANQYQLVFCIETFILHIGTIAQKS
jgi:hypothetical protein